MTDMLVKITSLPASPSWGEQAVLSISGQEALIHISANQDRLRTIKRAARQLDSLNIPVVSLVGTWHKNEQWAFAGSYIRAYRPGKIHFCENSDKAELEKALSALLFTRRLINETPEVMSPLALAQRSADWLKSLAPDAVSYQLITGEALQSQGWTGIYNVGRGSEREPVFLQLDYNPGDDEQASVAFALVGKGITFDSGGYSLKSSEGMLDMKCDMGGAATVTGALGLAIMQGLSKRVKLFLCCAENLVSGHAYKLGDILTYKNGTSVEIVNTDAEGRLVLADGLIAAVQSEAKYIIDAATLTGAATVALGYDYHAVFSLNPVLTQSLLSVAEAEDERFWPLPLEKWHQERCPSSFADTANSRAQKGGGAGGASNAAGFLSRFVAGNEQGWLHLDLAAAYHASANAEMPAGSTGAGVKTLAAFMRASINT